MNRRKSAIRWVRRIGTAAFLALLLPYLNYSFEFASRVEAHLGPNCPSYVGLIARFGMSWGVCYFAMAVIFVVLADYGMVFFPRLGRISISLMAGIALGCGSVFMVMDYLNRSTIPMVGGFLDTWPDGYWDWPSTFTTLAISLTVFWIGVKLYVLIKRRGRAALDASTPPRRTSND